MLGGLAENIGRQNLPGVLNATINDAVNLLPGNGGGSGSGAPPPPSAAPAAPPTPPGQVAVYDSSGNVIGFNPANQGTGYTTQSGTVNGESYTPPMSFNPTTTMLDFSGNGVLQTYQDYIDAQEKAADPSIPASQLTKYQDINGFINTPTGGSTAYSNAANGSLIKVPNGTPSFSTYYYDGDPTGAPIVYGTQPTNQVAATANVGVMTGGMESDPTINGIDYSQGASYANLAANGVGTPNASGGVTAYTSATDPGNGTSTSAAAPTGTQSYGANGQPIATVAPSSNEDVTFLYGDNGSLGSLSGTLSGANGPAPQTFGSVITNGNLTTQQNPLDSTDIGTFTANEGPSAGDTGMFSALNTATINQGDSQPGLGTFAGQTGASQAPTDTAQNYFTYGANYGQIQANDLAASTANGGVNQATGGVGGYNPLGLNQTNQSTLSGQDSALGYYGQVNPITGQTLANTNQTNPALQALQAGRSLN